LEQTADPLAALEADLRGLSHGDEALAKVRAFAEAVGGTRARQAVFNRAGALVRRPITEGEARAAGLLGEGADPLHLLQGDVIGTEAAYFLGSRAAPGRFVVANASCDLVPGRREYVALLRVLPVRQGDPDAKAVLGQLLRFRSTHRMYLPPLPGDPADVIGNAVAFDGIAQARQPDALLATRVASLTLVGWRILGSHLRGVLTRAGDEEIVLRTGLTAGADG
jgi:hypothetical protein